MENNMGDNPSLQNVLPKFEKMQSEIDVLRGKTIEPENISKVAVFGGCKKFENFEAAKTWISDKLWTEWLPTASEIYCKGDFHGILFCKFDSVEARDKVVKWFKKASIKVEDEDIWSKTNLLLSVRSVRSVLFDAKAYLTKWGFQNFGLWADFDKGTLEYQKKNSAFSDC